MQNSALKTRRHTLKKAVNSKDANEDNPHSYLLHESSRSLDHMKVVLLFLSSTTHLHLDAP